MRAFVYERQYFASFPQLSVWRCTKMRIDCNDPFRGIWLAYCGIGRATVRQYSASNVSSLLLIPSNYVLRLEILHNVKQFRQANRQHSANFIAGTPEPLLSAGLLTLIPSGKRFYATLNQRYSHVAVPDNRVSELLVRHIRTNGRRIKSDIDVRIRGCVCYCRVVNGRPFFIISQFLILQLKFQTC